MNAKGLIAAMALALAGTTGIALAQHMATQPGDPERWYRPNVTPVDRHQAAMKEAAAALKEALGDCREQASSSRSACMREAREQQRKDVGSANARLAEETSAWRS
jgi:hypothetical protein